jgi:hypothetical protein
MLSLIQPEEIKAKRDEILLALEQIGIPKELYRRVICKRKFRNDYDFVCELADELEPWDQTEIAEATIEDLRHFKKLFFFKQGTLIRERNELLTFLKEHPEFRSNSIVEVHDKMVQKFDILNEERRINNLPKFKYLNQFVEYGGIVKENEPMPLPPFLPMNQELHNIPSQENHFQVINHNQEN